MKKGDKLVALIGCTNDKTGNRFEAGDKIVAGVDFKLAVLKNWLEIEPPVVAVVRKVSKEVKNGSDS